MAVTKVNAEYQYPTVDRNFRAEREQETLAGWVRDTTSNVQTTFEAADRQMAQYAKTTPVGRVVRNTTAASLRKKRKKKATLEQKALARAKVTAANGWITAWTTFWYITVQLPFAVMSSIGLGIAATVLSYAINIRESSVAGRWLVDGIAGLVGQSFGLVAEVLEEITFWFTGVRVNPLALFAIPFVFLFGLGLLQLLLCWFIYSMLGIRSLSGSFATAKVSLFIIAAFGIAIPVLNLFPLIMAWTILVWFKPR